MNTPVEWREDPEGICPGCGKHPDGSAVTDSFLDTCGHSGTLIYASDGYLHLHGVSIATFDALTVRGSLKRWANHARLRSRWYLRRSAQNVKALSELHAWLDCRLPKIQMSDRLAAAPQRSGFWDSAPHGSKPSERP